MVPPHCNLHVCRVPFIKCLVSVGTGNSGLVGFVHLVFFSGDLVLPIVGVIIVVGFVLTMVHFTLSLATFNLFCCNFCPLSSLSVFSFFLASFLSLSTLNFFCLRSSLSLAACIFSCLLLLDSITKSCLDLPPRPGVVVVCLVLITGAFFVFTILL